MVATPVFTIPFFAVVGLSQLSRIPPPDWVTESYRRSCSQKLGTAVGVAVAGSLEEE